MHRYLLRRILQAIPVLLVISFISFMIAHAAPGDPTRVLADPNAPPHELERVRAVYGLDKPWYVQYYRWLGRVVQGDLGRSFIDGDKVTDKIARTLPNTLRLSVWAFLFSTLTAVAFGVISATRRYSALDYLTTVFSFAGLALPGFWFALMLILLFSVHLRWLPASGMGPLFTPSPGFLDYLPYYILPVLVLSIEGIAALSRYVRSSLLEVLGQDYVRTARSKGLSERVVIYKHAMRNALLPVVTIMGLAIPGLVGGALVVETIFAWPGMGRMAVGAVFQRDYNVIMGVNLMGAALTVAGNLLADLLYGVVDPRVRYQ